MKNIINQIPSTLTGKLFFIVSIFLLTSWYLLHSHVTQSEIVSKHQAKLDKIADSISKVTDQSESSKVLNSKALRETTTFLRSPVNDAPVQKSTLNTELLSSHFSNTTLIPSKKEESSNKIERNLHAVTYASHHGRDDRFCRSVESSIRLGYDLVILGWGKPWKGLSQKLSAAYEYASSIPENDLLLFTDAFDILFTGEASSIVKLFESHDYSLLFAAECGCWPHVMDDVNICLHKYPPSPTPYRYLNSGSWIGVAKYAKEMLAEVIRLAGNDFANANDQKLVADMFISGKFGIKLDYMSEIFQSMHRTDPPPLPSCNPSNDLRLNENKRWFNTRTNTLPAVFHFNGGGKAYHLKMESSVWYKDPSYYEGELRRQLLEAKIKVPTQASGFMTFKDLCSNYIK